MFTEVGAYTFVSMVGAFILMSQRWYYQALVFFVACLYVFHKSGADWLFVVFALSLTLGYSWIIGVSTAGRGGGS